MSKTLYGGRLRFLASGKVKDIYEIDAENLLFRFSDRVSAFDVQFGDEIPGKGKVLCQFAKYWFEKIPVPNHFVKSISETEIIVKKMRMLPLECIVRGYLYGSLAERLGRGEASIPGADTQLASKLPEPIFDPTTKSKHDVPVDKDKAVGMGLVSAKEYVSLSEISIKIYRMMAKTALDAGFIMADLKLEFGMLEDKIVLGDSIGPDEYRLWLEKDYSPGRIQESYDKQILRDWLASNKYKARFEAERAAGKEPEAPPIPAGVIEKMTSRYTAAFEQLTGQKV